MDKYIVINGVKYQIDPNDKEKALLDDKGEPIPYTEDDDKDKDKDKDNKVDLSKISLDELKKANPDIAKALKDAEDAKSALDKFNKDREDAERKAKADQGKWQELAEEETKKRREAEALATKSEEILNKYKSTVNGILEETIKTIPEDKRNLIPNDYSARKKLEYINNNAKTLGVTIGGKKGGEVPPNDKDINLDEESKVQKEYDELLKKGKDRTQIETAQMLQLAKKLKEIRQANEDKK